MSRIGKKPIAVPKGVTVSVQPDAVEIKGPKGTLKQRVPPGVKFRMDGAELLAETVREDRELSKYHGLARSLMANAVVGVTEGFKKELDIVGVGYRAEVKGKQVVFALGYSHSVVFDIPAGHRRGDRQADARDGDGDRSAARRPGRVRHPAAAQAGSVQAEGRAVHGRSAQEEGWKDGSVAIGLVGYWDIELLGH